MYNTGNKKSKTPNSRARNGFSLLELLVAIAIVIIIGAIVIPNIVSLQKVPQLNNTTQEVANILRLAQNQTLASKDNSQYGVYFNMGISPNTYVLFKGSDYTTRDSSADQTYTIPTIVEFYSINTGNGNEVVFDRLTGTTSNSGNISLRLKEDHSQTKIIYVDSSGDIGYTALSTPSDSARTKDSRHIDFNYSRNINTTNENIVLTFSDSNGTTTEVVPINPYMTGGQFNWQGTFSINGANQTLKIHTLRLNAPDTQFSVFRDLRYNTKAVTITISGDSTGTLAEYSADGLTTNFHSIYVNNFAWQ